MLDNFLGIRDTSFNIGKILSQIKFFIVYKSKLG